MNTESPQQIAREAAQPQRSEQQEWALSYDNARRGWLIVDGENHVCIFHEGSQEKDTFAYRQAWSAITRHNAALADERKKVQDIGEQLDSYVITVQRLERELAAERQRSAEWCKCALGGVPNKQVNEQLLSALAAIEDNWKNALLAIEILNSGWWGIDGSKERTDAIRCRNILRRIAPHEWESGKDIPPHLPLLHEHDAEVVLQYHVSQCAQCSGPDDGCDEGQRLEQIKIDALAKVKQ